MRDHHFIVVDAIHETARIAPARTIAITCRGGWAYNRFSRHALDFSREIRERYGDTTLTGWLALVFHPDGAPCRTGITSRAITCVLRPARE